ncbi:hypothetical protein DAKH74_023650 [Maudiozyma humilis]|uniref:Hyphally-regulated cell wall protein N-terminal domain-containing protein n=1 Tax=Maudiozyma humilis TaxID=51915 RepID=A0AAV5RW07_MAUHU|nr:hypothetical protein DAKH74_023650 [Kazachstania humilis]
MITQSFLILALLSILGRCAIVSQQLSSTNFLPGLRVRVFHPELGTVTLSAMQDYMKKKQYETNGELIGETDGVQDLRVNWVRYKSNMIHGIYVDPTIDGFIVEYRGYVKMTETKNNLILGSMVYPRIACNNDYMRQTVVNYMEFDTNMWVDNNDTGTYCVMNNTKSKYLNIGTAIGSVRNYNTAIGTSSGGFGQINKDVYYPIRFVGTFLGDGAYHLFSYHTSDNYDTTEFGSNELFYNPNENYNDLDSNQKLLFPQICPVYDSPAEEHLNTYPSPETTLPNICPATSSSTSIATPEVSTSQTSSSVATSSSSALPSTSEIISSSTIDSTSEQVSSSAISSSVIYSTVISSSVISSSAISSSVVSSSAVSSSVISSSAISSSVVSSSAVSSSVESSSEISSSAVSSSAVSSSAISSSVISSSSEPISSLVTSSSSEQLSTSETISSPESTPSSEIISSVTNVDTSDVSSISETISSNSGIYTSQRFIPVSSGVHSSAEWTSSELPNLSSHDVKTVSSQTSSSLEIAVSPSSEYSQISSTMSYVDSSTPSVSKTSDVGVSGRSSSTVISSSAVQDLSSTSMSGDHGKTDTANTRSATSSDTRISSSNTDISSTNGWNTQYSNQSAVTSLTNSRISDNTLSETVRSTIIHQGTVTQTEKCEMTHVCNTDENHPDTPNTGKDTTKTNRVTRSTIQLLDTLTSAETTTKSGPKTTSLEPNNPEQAINYKTTTTTSYGVKSTVVNIRPNDAGVSSVAQFHSPSEVEQAVSESAYPATSNVPTSTHIISQFDDQAVSVTISTSLLVVLLLANFM